MLADSTGVTSRAIPRLPGRNGKSTDMTAWADMLSMIGRRNIQLYDFLVRPSRQRSSGSAILRELERERSRIARELHAGAGQPLAGIKLNLEMLGDCFNELSPQGREALVRAQKLAQQALEQVRSVSQNLHPPEWQRLSATEAIRQLIESSGLEMRMAVFADFEPLPVEPSHATKIALYRCTQECISNIMRHSGATRFRLWLGASGSMLELRIEDNGHGFDHHLPGKGIGLQALREHASVLGGTCEVTSSAAGTLVAVKFPLTED